MKVIKPTVFILILLAKSRSHWTRLIPKCLASRQASRLTTHSIVVFICAPPPRMIFTQAIWWLSSVHTRPFYFPSPPPPRRIASSACSHSIRRACRSPIVANVPTSSTVRRRASVARGVARATRTNAPTWACSAPISRTWSGWPYASC